MMLIARQTMGYTDAIHEFSVRYISSKIGHGKPATIKALNGLINKKFIVTSNTGERGIRSLSVTIDDLSPITDDYQKRSQDVTNTGHRTLPELVTKHYQNRSQMITITGNKKLPDPVTGCYRIPIKRKIQTKNTNYVVVVFKNPSGQT